MDFLKKNWGLLLCSIVCLVLFVMLIVKCVGQRSIAREAQQKISDHRSFFEKLNKDNLTVTADENGELKNQLIAESNAEIVKRHYRDMLGDCAERYRITPDLASMRSIPSTRFRELVEGQLSDMATKLLKAKIVWLDGVPVGEEFGELFEAGKMVENTTRKQQVYRNLQIYDRVVDLVINSGVKAVVEFNLPREYQDEEKDYYRSTPMAISVQGTEEQIQAFINGVTYSKNLFCIIKSMGVELVDNDDSYVVFSPYLIKRNEVRLEKEAELTGGQVKDRTMMGGMTDRPSRRSSSSRNQGPMGGGMMGMDGNMQEDKGPLRGNRMVGNLLGASFSDNGMGGGMMGGAAGRMEATGMGRSSRRDSMNMGMGGTGRTDVMGGGRTMTGMNDGLGGMSNLWHFGEPKRQDFIVFAKKRILQLDMNIEIVEFTPPEKESDSENADSAAEG